MKSQLEEIKANHEFRKGEGWEFTTLTEDIDWLIEQAEQNEGLKGEIENNYRDIKELQQDKRELEKEVESLKKDYLWISNKLNKVIDA
jgi:peptidoglycan hydrolase CwlO-like protein